MRRMLKPWLVSLFMLLLAGGLSAQRPEPEDYVIRLERVGSSTRVLVVGGWTVHEVQGWSYGICHDPAEVFIPCTLDNIMAACADSPCPYITCPDDVATCNNGHEPDFHSIYLFENGITQGAVHNFM